MRDLLPADPRAVGPYRLLARLGGGGMGRVFLGLSRGGRVVAVKLVRPELAEDAQFRRRFTREVQAARRVGGFYTAQVVDADTEATPPWLVTSYISGPTLREAIVECGPLPANAVAALGAGLAEGLKAIHVCDVLHRDLKPGNIILAGDGPRIIDLGIARALDVSSYLTQTGVIGTPAFMSPEQIRGREIGPASDTFCLAAVLVYAATGRGPFGDGPTEAVVYRVVHDEPDLSGLPDQLAGLVSAGLAKDPDDRPSVTEVLTRCAALAGSTGLRLPAEVTEMIDKQVTETNDLTTETIPHSPATVEERTPTATTPAPRSMRATAQDKTPAGAASVALPWLPGETAGARKTTVIRWHKQVGDAIAEGEALLEVSSVRGDTVITSPASGTLLAVHRPAGKTARAKSVIAAIGKPGEPVPRRPMSRPLRLALVSSAYLAAVLLVVAAATWQLLAYFSIDPDPFSAKVGDCIRASENAVTIGDFTDSARRVGCSSFFANFKVVGYRKNCIDDWGPATRRTAFTVTAEIRRELACA
ncbi:serine/threonine protein kinase [Streptomyces diacarni]|uniref:Serine/threonine protein kinase n=1 Tax=Streptomyces diacarni TaxID=2800381 RepID=A0A367EJF2_9ACTN|nr:protein kinase [Streptomyces diacarni]RCG17755.1 serine/threonine protein kinase [Streptomyces diacarni]